MTSFVLVSVVMFLLRCVKRMLMCSFCNWLVVANVSSIDLFGMKCCIVRWVKCMCGIESCRCGSWVVYNSRERIGCIV